METDPRRWISALRTSHDALVTLVAALSPEQLTAPSYCGDWDVAQVLAHIGSGAEIALLQLERALARSPQLDRADFTVIWDRWSAYAPDDKANEMSVWDRRYVSVLEGLDDETLASLRMSLFGMEFDAVGVVGIRLGEHAVHSWDVAVAFDAGAQVLPTSVELLVDRLPFIAGRVGRPEGAKTKGQIEVRTARPERRLLLSIANNVALTEDVEGQPDGVLDLPAEAFLRLVHGRLDAGHTPPRTHAEGIADLDELRQVFPGI